MSYLFNIRFIYTIQETVYCTIQIIPIQMKFYWCNILDQYNTKKQFQTRYKILNYIYEKYMNILIKIYNKYISNKYK